MYKSVADSGGMRWQVHHCEPVTYDIRECPSVLDPVNPALAAGGESSRRIVFVDESVADLYGERIRTYFSERSMQCTMVQVPGGEQTKNLASYAQLVRELDRFNLSRRGEPIIVIGGGVMTDLGGFVASTYRRGVAYIRVPTTIMGYVDAAIGVKTGINFANGKNRIGTFQPPVSTLLDVNFLGSLPRRHISNGLAEMVKLAVISDRRLFEELEEYSVVVFVDAFQGETGLKILRMAIDGMLAALSSNLYELSLERTMDFGHTFSPRIEMETSGQVLHGEAVSIDIALSCVLASYRNMLSDNELNRVLRLLSDVSLPTYDGSLQSTESIVQSLSERSAHRGGHQRIPLPIRLGECRFVNDVSADEVERAVNALAHWAS